MKLVTKEHYELMEAFERSHTGLRLDREPKDLWSRGHIYQNDETNSLFRAYREGYAFCLAANRQDDPARLSAELAEAWKQLELAAAALDEASEEVGDWGAYAGDYFQNKHDLEGCVKEIAQQASSIRSFLASKEASR